MVELKWAEYDDESLLKVRICDLGLSIEGTDIAIYIDQLYSELDAKGLTFHPRCYLADEWLCPDEEPIIGIPFFLAHSRLKKLEKKMVLEVEGGSKEQFMRLLRHEAGHTFNYAYRLYKKRKWGEFFGSFNEEYPDTYIPRPYSRKYVRHLENCYAQYHPDEDFAETFAVWLTPGKNWEEEYNGWRVALAKLKYVDKLMADIAGKDPVHSCDKQYWSASKLKQTLDYYYKRRRREFAEDLPGFFDPELKKIFRETSGRPKESAKQFIRKHRRQIIKSMGMWTGKNKYLINEIMGKLLSAASELELQRYTDQDVALLELATYVNTMVMNRLFTGRLKQCP